ncbi:DUF2634 domain-containing protein [Paenibacillus sp. N1-5-1-14]|uniref:DUF2634 domain-containing protein n=1 Tax=Paenibacillus radicibacter TaxID=2972488 RepID=UPI0021592329|nr:DUF2634 domain-containing protein [Paenibacillus radicibacter]MCR8645590.1 DUF2634 domain-containing protein [Paenibacillus radicibacter]
MSGIFPFIDQSVETVEAAEQNLVMFKEYAWDFEKNDFVMHNGRPVVLEGNDALMVWAYKALKTERYRYLAYSWNFGVEFDRLMGSSFSSSQLQQTEAERYLREALLVNPYIKDVAGVQVSFTKDVLNMSFKLLTVYGEVNMNV